MGVVNKEAAFGAITFARCPHFHPTHLMGKLYRRAISGEVRMCGAEDFPDYGLVDLYTRPVLESTFGQYVTDEYLFRPVPLAHRTWIYHTYFREQLQTKSPSEIAMLEMALSERCIDAPMDAGRWSPVMCFAWTALATSLTGNYFIVVPAIVCFALLYLLSKLSNSPGWYKYERIVSFPLRFAFLAFVFMQVDTSDAVAVIGAALVVLFSAIDVIWGDISQLFAYRHLCAYDVLSVLPNRVLICQRRGAAHLEDTFGDRGLVPEAITGIGSWARTFTMIADIHGLLFELRPMSQADWQALRIRIDTGRKPPLFVGLDVYTHKCKTAREREAQLQAMRLGVGQRVDTDKYAGPPMMRLTNFSQPA